MSRKMWRNNMSKVKLAVIYYSSTGTNYQMALAAKESAEKAGAEVRLRRVAELAPQAAIDQNPAWRAHLDGTKNVPEVTLEDLEWGNAYIFGTPTRFGNVAAQVKQFLDTTGGLWFQGKLANKVVAGFTSAQAMHGGQETTLLALYNTFYHWGCIIVPPGYTDEAVHANGGNPYGASTNASPDGEIPETAKAAAHHLARRVVQVAEWIAEGQA
jgi:NAD(P)H dehydrogenase (quinone)